MKSAAPEGVPAHDDHTDATFRRELPKTVNAAGIAISSSAPTASNDENTASQAVTPQRKWQRRMKAAGRCVICGEPRNLYWSHCDPCQVKVTAKLRAKSGHKPWRPGGIGRPPACHSIKNPVQKAA